MGVFPIKRVCINKMEMNQLLANVDLGLHQPGKDNWLLTLPTSIKYNSMRKCTFLFLIFINKVSKSVKMWWC